jgi:hypothetical protein
MATPWWRLDGGGGERQGAAGPFGLGVAVGADRPPDGGARGDGRAGGLVAVEVGVGPLQGAGFFGAEPGQQAERDVGVHHGGDWFVGGQEQSGVLGAELGQVGHGR